MKRTHRPDLLTWSRFDESRDVDFNSYAWMREAGAVLFDPLPMSAHDRAQLGPVAWIVVSNRDHARDAAHLARELGAPIAGPAQERETLGLDCARWLSDGETLVEGLEVLELDGSKTPGELAFVLDGSTLITGDLIRSHHGGALHRLPSAKLTDERAAFASIRRLAALPAVSAVLVGDGWPVFRDGRAHLEALVATL